MASCVRSNKLDRSRELSTADSQQGVVLVVVVMVVFLMVTLLAFLVEDQHLLSRRVVNQRIDEQGFQYAQGVNEWAMRVLHEDKDRQMDSVIEDWAKFGRPDPDSELEEAEDGFTLSTGAEEDEEAAPTIDFGDVPLSYSIDDLQGKYNLNNLGETNPARRLEQKQIFLNLLDQVGVTEFDTKETLYATLADWLDGNKERSPNGKESDDYAASETPYYAADQQLVSLGELKFVSGFTTQIIADLEPFVTVLPVTNAQININSTSAETLAALSKVPIFDIGTVQGFLARRNEPEFLGFNSGSISEAENAIIGVAAAVRQPPISGMMSVASQFFQINVKIELDKKVYCMRTKVLRKEAAQEADFTKSFVVISREYDTLCQQTSDPINSL
ncbi:MAG: type II secretion system minor pseudopilin GspK [Pseudomonadota bacterium]